MGKRRGWISAVKKIFSCHGEHNREKRNSQQSKWIAHQRSVDLDSSATECVAVASMDNKNEQSRRAYSVAFATAVAAEAAVAAANAAAEIVRLTSGTRNEDKTKEELAAIKIQTAFRGYLARRALKALRGLMRLRRTLGGQSVMRQTDTTLKLLQRRSRVQYEISARRYRMSEANSALQRQIQQKHEKKLEKLRASIGEDWDDSMQSKERVDANLQHRQEAALRRERALAYAYSHQTCRIKCSTDQTFTDISNPRWGWSWLERRMSTVTRPWENQNGTALDKDLKSDRVSSRTVTNRSVSFSEESMIIESPARQVSYCLSRQSPSARNSKSARKIVPPPGSRGTNVTVTDEDSNSNRSIQSEQHRRRSIAAGSSVKDCESFSSSPFTTRSYMASTESARAKSRPPSPGRVVQPKPSTPDKESFGSAKKRLSFPSSPAASRRHSGPPKIDSSLIRDITAN